MRKIKLYNMEYYIVKYNGITLLFDVKDFNVARSRANKYSLELSDIPWWRFW